LETHKARSVCHIAWKLARLRARIVCTFITAAMMVKLRGDPGGLMPDSPFGPAPVAAGAFKGEPVPGRHWTAMPVIVGMLVGLAIMVLLVRLLPRDATGAGLGLNTQGVYDVHPRGRFHFAVTAGPEFMDAARQLDPARKVLWLGASQVYGINNYH